LRILADIKPQTDDDADAPAQAIFGKLMDCLDIVPGISQMPQGTSRPASCHITLGSGTPQLNTSILGIAPNTKPDVLLIQNAKPVEL
jgi:hypothetical protein